jgi:hypothetical protein
MVVEFRRLLLPLNDVLGCLREAMPLLSRSALHRCRAAARHLTATSRRKAGPKRKCFAETKIGYIHVDVYEPLAQGKLFMFLAIDRVSQFARVAFPDANIKADGAAFLRVVVEVFPYQIHTIAQRSAGGMPGNAGLGSPTTGRQQAIDPIPERTAVRRRRRRHGLCRPDL